MGSRFEIVIDGLATSLIYLFQPAVADILESYRLSSELDPEWYKAWHAWALANSKVASHYERNQDASSVPVEIVQYHLVPAVHGAITCSRTISMVVHVH